MGYHPRIETSEYADFLTTRTRNSELWFLNNEELEDAILGYAAKYSTIHKVSLYALAVEGNHIHAPAQFTEGNRGRFMRDFNSAIARAVPRYTPHYPGGGLWARRYSQEFLPAAEDIEERFFYTVLQPVQDGLVQKISEYPGYNCFHDAIHGIERVKKVMNWAAYYEAKRWDPKVSTKDFVERYTLKFMRLPGYEELSQREYAALMMKKLESRRVEIVRRRLAEGKGFAGKKSLLNTHQGASPRSTKTSTQSSHRPRVLSVCPKRRAEALSWYFSIYFEYQEASERYRAGDYAAEFPPGTYRPFASAVLQ